MRHCLHDIISALAYSLSSAARTPSNPELRPPYNDITRFILGQLRNLPDYLRAPMQWSTLAFDLAGMPKCRALFRKANANKREQWIAAAKSSAVPPLRDLIQYYESLATLALYERMGDHRLAHESFRDPQDVISRAMAEESPGTLRCDIAVVGSGPGGSITACLLAEAGRDVLLIEEGPFHSLNSCEPFSLDEMVQKYRNNGQTVALGRSKIAYVEGRCVGGGSEINSGLYHRTPPEILELWRRDYLVEGISETELLPSFETCERDLTVSRHPEQAPAASLKLHEGATRLGWRSLEVPRWFRCQAEHPGGGVRQSMTMTYIPRFLQSGGKLQAETRIQRLRQTADRWELLGNDRKHKEVRIEARTVFLCAGAIQTPALLQRSGISRNIGNTLKLHPTVKAVAEFSEEVNARHMGVPVHQVKEFAPRVSLGCSVSTPSYVALGLLPHASARQRVAQDWRRMANYYAMTVAEGFGTIRNVPGFRDPVVRYGLTRSERQNLGDGLRKLCLVLLEAGAVAVFPGLAETPVLRSADQIERVLPAELPERVSQLMTIHLFSSCPMGEDRSKCATDSFGKVHGVKNLHIADASLLCTAPGVNPQGTIMAIARRNALRFLGKL